MSRLLVAVVLSLTIPFPASSVTMDWTPVGDPNNACDGPTCRGAVAYPYLIGTYEVTNAQYAEFLNAKAASDPLGLYHPNMGSIAFGFDGGIARSGTSGSYSYSVLLGQGNDPVNWVSFYDALRFANWMNNGQGNGSTELGAYTLLGGTATPINGATVTRDANAAIFLANQDEWYKAAYYDAVSTSYFDYPTSSNLPPTCAFLTPSPPPNRANCGAVLNQPAPVGSYTGSESPYGTSDQGGNVAEWTETPFGTAGARVIRGGGFHNSVFVLAASFSQSGPPEQESSATGFRLAMIPEPSTGLLVIGGLLGIAGWRRARGSPCATQMATLRAPGAVHPAGEARAEARR